MVLVHAVLEPPVDSGGRQTGVRFGEQPRLTYERPNSSSIANLVQGQNFILRTREPQFQVTFQLRRNAKEVTSAKRRDVVLQQPGIRYSADIGRLASEHLVLRREDVEEPQGRPMRRKQSSNEHWFAPQPVLFSVSTYHKLLCRAFISWSRQFLARRAASGINKRGKVTAWFQIGRPASAGGQQQGW